MADPVLQTSYAAGELSPALGGRVDLAKYKVGLQLQRDMFSVVSGGSVSRPGTQFIGVVEDSTVRGRLVRFKYATGDTYVLEFGDKVMRVIRNGAYVGSPYELVTPYAAADLPGLKFTQSFDKVTITHRGYEPMDLTRSDHDNWTLAAKAYGPTTAAPTITGFTVANSGPTVYTYQVTAVSDETGEESLPDQDDAPGSQNLSSSNSIFVLFTLPAGCSKGNVYRSENGVFQLIAVSTGSALDIGQAPTVGATPPQDRDPFTGSGNYPRCSSYYANRAFYGGTSNKPQTVWASVVGSFDNMSVSQPTRDDDAIVKTVASRDSNDIRSMVSLDDLLMFTGGGLWRGTAHGNPVTPASLEFMQQTYEPISALDPIVAGEDVLFVHEYGAPVYRVTFEAISTRWRPADMSVLSRHFFDHYQIVDWCYAAYPFNLIWAVRSDGKLLTFTYLKEQEVYAWALHDVGGEVESICSVPEGGEDAVYMIVKRTVSSATVRYVERLHSRKFTNVADGWFLDCALRYEGTAATTISGLAHLEGKEVVALADGVVVRGKTVTSGAITLSTAAAKVLVGLAYTPTMRTLGVEAAGDLVKAASVALRVYETRGGKIGPRPDELTDIRYYEALGDVGTASELFSGKLFERIHDDWDSDGAIYITQPDPYPMTILSHSLELLSGGEGAAIDDLGAQVADDAERARDDGDGTRRDRR